MSLRESELAGAIPAERMSGRRRLAFALGAPGYMAIETAVSGILLYFYLPPPGRGLVPLVPEETFFGVFTAFGLAVILARAVDSAASLAVGYASDRSRSRWGRRRSFMLCGILPMAGLPVLVYWPPGAPGSTLNVLWLMLLLAFFYLFAAMYIGPHGALVPEITRSDQERARLSRMIALASFPMAAIMMAWPRALDWGRAAGFGATESIRGIVLAVAVTSFLLCAIPFFAIDEGRFAPSAPSELSVRAAFGATFSNGAFRIYLAAHILFAMAGSMIFPVLPYVAIVLLGRSEGFAFDLGASLGGMMALGMALIPRLLVRIGAKALMVGCYGLFAAAAASLGLIRPDVPGGPEDARNLTIAFVALGTMGLPIAGVSILPNVFLGQLIDDDARRTGTNRAAIYIGVVRACDKWAFGIAAATIAFLFANFGKAPDEPLGVLLVGPIAALAGAASAVLFTRFPEVPPSQGERAAGDSERPRT